MITRQREPNKYRGCYRDGRTRMFPYSFHFNNVCTIPHCINFCREAGYVYAGLQYYYQCFCGNTFPKPKTNPKLTEDICNMPCHGNASQICGGHWANSVYETGNESKG